MSISFTHLSITYTAHELFRGASAADQQGGVRYTRVYQVHTSQPHIHPSQVYAAALAQRTTLSFVGRLPLRRDKEGAYACQSVRVQPDEATDDIHIYTAEFALDTFGASANPVDDPPEISWGGVDRTEPYDIDADGKAVVNTVRERFEPLPERFAGEDAVTIVVKRATWSPTLGSMYSYTTNSTTMWSVVSPGKALMGRIEAVKQREEGYTFWRVTFPITFAESWEHKLLNVGTRIAVGTNQWESITVKVPQTGQRVPVPEPVLISADGSSVYTGSLTSPPTVTFRPYRSANWSSLSIPNPF